MTEETIALHDGTVLRIDPNPPTSARFNDWGWWDGQTHLRISVAAQVLLAAEAHARIEAEKRADAFEHRCYEAERRVDFLEGREEHWRAIARQLEFYIASDAYDHRFPGQHKQARSVLDAACTAGLTWEEE